MNELKGIINQYAELRKTNIEKQLNLLDIMLSQQLFDIGHKLIREREEYKVYGGNFNVFELLARFVSIGETTHSRLLHFLLSNDHLHQQGSIFLNLFLEYIKISDTNIGTWYVTAEKERVDVMIRREYPKSVIVIENKSNWAVDQENQLYRYWYENIHHFENETNKENFKIIYLAPYGKTYNLQSVMKPKRDWKGFSKISDSEYHSLPPKVPMKITELTFDKLSEWLNMCIGVLNEKNHPMREYINQYMKFCKTL